MGREAHALIARRVGLSRSALQERIARLERDGVIAGYTVRLGARRQAGAQAYILVSAEGPNHDRTVAALAGIPEIKSCESLSGEVDIILRVEAETLAAHTPACPRRRLLRLTMEGGCALGTPGVG